MLLMKIKLKGTTINWIILTVKNLKCTYNVVNIVRFTPFQAKTDLNLPYTHKYRATLEKGKE